MRLETVLPATVVDIQHIGSTAVPGLDAKPIIDIGIAIERYDDIEDVTDALTERGYTYRGHLSEQMGHVYQVQVGDRVTHIVHVLEYSSPHYKDYLLMRDYLRANENARQAYQHLKQDLATRYPHQRRSYTRGKHDLITSLLIAARRTDSVTRD